MKITFLGAGALVPIALALGFLAVALGVSRDVTDYHIWPYGLALGGWVS